VTPEQAAAIVPHLPAKIEKIGVFVDVSFDEIAATVEAAGLTGVQLHWDTPPELPAALRARYGPRLRILRVVHFGEGTPDESATFAEDENVDAILVDSRTDAAVGGTGESFDWTLASKSLLQGVKARGHRIVAAGGLNPENVADAVAMLRPWGVDVVSGVEAAPGRKDSAKVRAFIANVRAAQM
jgi:phosphoribosylanthranilate isomerase